MVKGEYANINNNTDILTFAYGVHDSDRTVRFEWWHCCFDLHIVDVPRIIDVLIGHFGLLFPDGNAIVPRCSLLVISLMDVFVVM